MSQMPPQKSTPQFALLSLFSSLRQNKGTTDKPLDKTSTTISPQKSPLFTPEEYPTQEFLPSPVDDEKLDSPSVKTVKHTTSLGQMSSTSTPRSIRKLSMTTSFGSRSPIVRRQGSLESNLDPLGQKDSPQSPVITPFGSNSPLSQSFNRFFGSTGSRQEIGCSSPSKSNLLEYKSQRKHATVDSIEVNQILTNK
jgi:hypothetical protein